MEAVSPLVETIAAMVSLWLSLYVYVEILYRPNRRYFSFTADQNHWPDAHHDVAFHRADDWYFEVLDAEPTVRCT